MFLIFTFAHLVDCAILCFYCDDVDIINTAR